MKKIYITIEAEDIYDNLKYHPKLTDDDKQNIVIKLYKKICGNNPLVKFETINHFSSYVTKTVKNEIIDKHKKEKNKEEKTNVLSHYDYVDYEGVEYNSILQQMNSDELNPQELMEQDDLKESVLEVISELSPIQKEVMLNMIDGERIVDIAKRVGKNHSTIKLRYYWGKEKFKKKWKIKYGGYKK